MCYLLLLLRKGKVPDEGWGVSAAILGNLFENKLVFELKFLASISLVVLVVEDGPRVVAAFGVAVLEINTSLSLCVEVNALLFEHVLDLTVITLDKRFGRIKRERALFIDSSL